VILFNENQFKVILYSHNANIKPIYKYSVLFILKGAITAVTPVRPKFNNSHDKIMEDDVEANCTLTREIPHCLKLHMMPQVNVIIKKTGIITQKLGYSTQNTVLVKFCDLHLKHFKT
jgi:hypothetical protein